MIAATGIWLLRQEAPRLAKANDQKVVHHWKMTRSGAKAAMRRQAVRQVQG